MTLEDRIFGEMTYLDRRISRYRSTLEGVKHQMRVDPLRPKPGQPLTVFLFTCGPQAFDAAQCWYTVDGQQPGENSTSRVSLHPDEVIWDMIRWEYVQVWRGEIPPQQDRTVVRYCLGAKRAGSDDWVFADNQAGELSQGTIFATWVSADETPEWVREALIYHVFLDRFYPGEGRDWKQPESLSGFLGGTLRGVIQKLDYIQAMGFNALWLSPLFASPSYHGYNATDYYTVEPRLGTNEDLRELIDEAHWRGIRILLDFVANHWSSGHPTFQSARSDLESPYRDWYIWEQWPQKYKTYFGVQELPTLNLAHPQARQYILDCAAYWLRQGVDGYRLDYALGPSYDFWVDFRRTCREADPDCWMIGEVVDMAPVQLSYAGCMDGTLDFLLNQALRGTFGHGTWTLTQFEAFLSAHERYFPQDFIRPSFLDNHDMNRFLYITGGDKHLLKLAALVMYTLPGPPIVYYGTETGVSQERPIHQNNFGIFEEARLPMKWGDEQDADLVDYFRRLGSLRSEYPELLNGERRLVYLDDQAGLYAFVRSHGQEKVLVAINMSDESRILRLSGLDLNSEARDRLDNCLLSYNDGHWSLELPAKTGAFVA
jgi:glycosidase